MEPRSSTFTYIDLGLELFDGLHRSWSNDDLTARYLFTLETTEENPQIVSSLGLPEV
jgi:hypothetical protein